MVVFFETARRALGHSTREKLVLFTNSNTLPNVDGINLADYLANLDVRIVVIPYTWKPAGRIRLWFNQFYLFDILSHLGQTLTDGDAVLIADCDCVFVRDPSSTFELIRRDGFLLITVDETLTCDEKINGLSRREAEAVYERLSSKRPQTPPNYFGGECYGLTRETLLKLMPLACEAKPKNDEFAANGELYLSDEAHLISYLMWRMGFTKSNGNEKVRRIWTTWKNNTTRAEDLTLTLWHLPSEKQVGFDRVFKKLSTWPPTWTHEQNLHWLAREMGVGRKYMRKYATHLWRAVKKHLFTRT